jgi:hypothetical protein
MNKSEALELLNEIIASCPVLASSGFYTRDVRSSSDGKVELRLLASLDPRSRKTFSSLVANRGLKLIEEKGLLIVY